MTDATALPGVALYRTPLDRWHARHAARFSVCHGWRVAVAYTSPEDEVAAARARIGLVDISAFAKARLSGAIQTITTRAGVDAVQATPGRAFAMKLDDAPIGCRLTNDKLLVLAATPDATGLHAQLATLVGDLPVERHEVTSELAGIHVIGPNSEAVFRRLTNFDLSLRSFPPGSCAETSCAGIHATLVRDPAWTVAALRIYVAWDLGEYMWQRLVDAGRNLGITPVGVGAWEIMAGTQGQVARV